MVFYFFNGFRFSYDVGMKDILKRFASNEADVDRSEVLQYLRSHTEQIALEDAVD